MAQHLRTDAQPSAPPTSPVSYSGCSVIFSVRSVVVCAKTPGRSDDRQHKPVSEIVLFGTRVRLLTDCCYDINARNRVTESTPLIIGSVLVGKLTLFRRFENSNFYFRMEGQ